MDDSFSLHDDGDAAADHRGAHRDSLFLHATLRRAGGEAALTMRIRNLSAGGMMAEIGEPFEEGDPIAIEIRGLGMLDGHVIWRADNRIGIAFDRPVDPRQARKSVAVRSVAPAPAAAFRTPRRPRLFGE